MAIPALSAAATTSSSRIDPPGWITATAPASIATSRPSAKGKNASDATTDPLCGDCPSHDVWPSDLPFVRQDSSCQPGSSARHQSLRTRRPLHKLSRLILHAWQFSMRSAYPLAGHQLAYFVTMVKSASVSCHYPGSEPDSRQGRISPAAPRQLGLASVRSEEPEDWFLLLKRKAHRR